MKHQNWALRAILICVFLWLGAEIIHTLSVGQKDSEQSVLAWVGDKKITVADYENHFYLMQPDSQRYYATVDHRSILLYYLIREKFIPQMAQKMGYGQDPGIAAQMMHISRLNPFQAGLIARDKVLSSALIARLYAGELKVTSSAIRRYYDFHKDLYEKAVFIKASRIYLPTKQDVVLAQYRLASHVPFDQVAREMSRDRFTAPGGEMEPILVNRKIPLGFEERTLLMMQIGHMSGAIEKDGGYIILKLNAIEPVTLETVSPIILQVLQEEKINTWIKQHWNDIQIRIDENLLMALELRAPH